MSSEISRSRRLSCCCCPLLLALALLILLAARGALAVLHLLRQLLGLLAKLVLFASQALELTFQLLGFHLLAIAGEFALLAIERVLPPRELANPIERILLRGLGPLLGGIRRLVIGRLPLTQLLIEEAREIRFGPILPAAATRLL